MIKRKSRGKLGSSEEDSEREV